jgi:hypothetical protein
LRSGSLARPPWRSSPSNLGDRCRDRFSWPWVHAAPCFLDQRSNLPGPCPGGVVGSGRSDAETGARSAARSVRRDRQCVARRHHHTEYSAQRPNDRAVPRGVGGCTWGDFEDQAFAPAGFARSIKSAPRRTGTTCRRARARHSCVSLCLPGFQERPQFRNQGTQSVIVCRIPP